MILAKWKSFQLKIDFNWIHLTKKQQNYKIRLFHNLSQHTSDDAYIGKTIQVFQKIITYVWHT